MKNKNELGIYIHIPFCVHKCIYCDFLSSPADEKTRKRYVKALIREINEKTKNAPLTEEEIKTYAKSVEHALVDQLLDKGLKAAKDYNVKQIVLGGGVSANSYLRAEIVKRAGKDYEVIIPPLWCTTDNAAMIAKVGSYLYEKKQFMDFSEGPVASLDLSEDW